ATKSQPGTTLPQASSFLMSFSRVVGREEWAEPAQFSMFRAGSSPGETPMKTGSGGEARPRRRIRHAAGAVELFRGHAGFDRLQDLHGLLMLHRQQPARHGAGEPGIAPVKLRRDAASLVVHAAEAE